MLGRLLLRVLRVAPRPTTPPGAGADVETFNPSRKFLALSWVRWGIQQVSTLVGLLFSLAFLGAIRLPFQMDGVEEVRERILEEMDRPLQVGAAGFSIDTDIPLLQLIGWFEILAVGFFVVQLVISATLVGLRYRTHWYMVSERMLGIRKGLWTVREQTMSVANVQNMKIKQGPIQRLLGLSDLEVHTAGGAGKIGDDAKKKDDLHVGRFEGLDDAEGLRRQVRATLARHRGAGLGDPDEVGEVEQVADRSSPQAEQPIDRFPPTVATPNGEIGVEAKGLTAETVRARRAVEALMASAASR